MRSAVPSSMSSNKGDEYSISIASSSGICCFSAIKSMMREYFMSLKTRSSSESNIVWLSLLYVEVLFIILSFVLLLFSLRIGVNLNCHVFLETACRFIGYGHCQSAFSNEFIHISRFYFFIAFYSKVFCNFTQRLRI